MFEDITSEGVEAMARGLTADIRLDELTLRNATYRHEDDTPATVNLMTVLTLV